MLPVATLARPGEDAWRLFELKQCEGGTTQDWLAAVPKLVIEVSHLIAGACRAQQNVASFEALAHAGRQVREGAMLS